MVKICELVQIAQETHELVMLNEDKIKPQLGSESKYNNVTWYLDT